MSSPVAGPGDAAHRAALRADLLRFLASSRHPLGFGWLRDDGTRDPTHPVQLYVTCRMTYVAALAALLDEPTSPVERAELEGLVGHGVSCLLGGLHDHEHGGWFASIDADGPVDTAKQAYGHAFVVLAAAAADATGAPDADRLLAMALDDSLAHFWDEDEGLVVDEWDRGWQRLSPYRGMNANMHTVEAYLAAGDVTGDRQWFERADRIATRMLGWARGTDWRIPEHFDADWQPQLDHNRDDPAHPFHPYGATVGHGLEWSRLLVAVDDALERRGETAVHREAALAVHERAVTDGWHADGRPGFVYTTDWDGTPVVRLRMHWVLAEAIAAAVTMHRVTGARRHLDRLATWWAYAQAHMIDADLGSWHHELDEANTPSSTVWDGKPDVYHAYQACLAASVPRAASFIRAVSQAAAD